MVGVWTYPWTLYEEGVDTAFETFTSHGITSVSVATHHHSARILQPRFPDSLFERRPAGCYFAPQAEHFDRTPLSPIQNEIEAVSDPLGEITAVADEYNVRTNGWMVTLHNSRLGATYPSFQIEDAFGTGHEHALCPSHPEVREYFAGVAAELVDRGVDAIELEAAGYPLVFHGHDTVYGHEAQQVLSSDAERRLFSQCFCDACQRQARDFDVDLEQARERTLEIIERSFRDPASQTVPLSALVREESVLTELFEFRAAIIERLIESIATSAGDTTVNVYVRRAEANWPAGRTLDGLAAHADRLTVLCYVADPAVARDRLSAITRRVSLPIDAGVTLDPSIIENESELVSLVDEIRTVIDGRVSVYNHAMLTETQLEWIEQIAT
ncbi:alpha-amylase family protein [Natrinema ejinorense]|uniref:Uncharacterized protein n=1 Tax=Natrinema ejinorense TaxID=373386 RepID=A0A2A5QQ96_9EURY|nr:hypothetical protein [Natrinema ejinorense]PCR89007.1 hypothetical protein CP557_21310 [Natrinema ejinorense]